MISSRNNSWNFDITSVKITKSLFTAYLPTKRNIYNNTDLQKKIALRQACELV